MNLWFQNRPKVEKRIFFDSELEMYAHIAEEIRAEMTIGVLDNPLGAGYFNFANYGQVRQQFTMNTAATGGPFALGTLVEFLTPYTGPGTTATPAVVNVTPSSITADTKLAGVLDNPLGTGEVANAAATVAAGKLCTVLRAGPGQILCDATTTAGGTLIQSAATAGAAKTGTAVVNQNIGTALQAVTISSGTALVWADIWKT